MQERGGAKWVLNHRRNEKAAVQLFCLPYAGGSAASFRTWTEKLAATFELWSVELPGRGRRYQEAPERRIDAMVPPLAMALRSVIDRPFAFFGHSMGAVLGFETTYALLPAGLRPVVLIVSGRRAPHLPSRKPVMHDLPDDAFIAKLRELAGTPEAILRDPEMMQLLLPCLRADFEAAERYEFGSRRPALDCPVAAYGGLSDDVSGPELDAWQEHTSRPLVRRMFPGDHFFLHSSEKQLLPALTKEVIAAFT